MKRKGLIITMRGGGVRDVGVVLKKVSSGGIDSAMKKV